MENRPDTAREHGTGNGARQREVQTHGRAERQGQRAPYLMLALKLEKVRAQG
jgi:hypothetical protein